MQYWLCEYEGVTFSIIAFRAFSPMLRYLKVDSSLFNLSATLRPFQYMYITLWIKRMWYCIDIASIIFSCLLVIAILAIVILNERSAVYTAFALFWF